MVEDNSMPLLRSAAGGAGLAAGFAGLIVFLATGWSPARGGTSDTTDPLFKAALIDGREVSGRIASLDDSKLTIATKGGAKEAVPFDRLVKVTRESPGAIAAGESTQAVLLGEGDRLMRAMIG